MNKYLFILGFVGTALFTACSTADDLVAEDPNGTPPDETTKETTLIVEASQNSEIPITLGVGQSRGYTRAPIDPTNVDEETKFGNFETEDGRYLGVFCLATDYQELFKDNPPIENNWTDNDDTGLIMRMKNVPAKVAYNGTTLTYDVIFPNFSSEDPLVDVYYYPMGNWMKYNFYAYYPWQDEELYNKTLTFKNNRVLEKYYEIDGSQDIIWGMADPAAVIDEGDELPAEAKPFCAKYYRWRKNHIPAEKTIANYYPELKFYHKLAQFRFFVKAAKASDNPSDHTILDKLTAMNMQVTDMYIGNAINRLELVVADQSGKYDGDLFWFGNYLATKALPIKAIGSDTDRFVDGEDEGDEVDNPLEITTDDKDEVLTGDPVGYIMLAPPSIPSFNATFSNNPSEEPATNKHIYQLYLKVKYDTASGGTDTNVLALSLDPLVVGLETFDEGNIYNIIVNVQSPEQISATAVLQEWKPGGTYQY